MGEVAVAGAEVVGEAAGAELKLELELHAAITRENPAKKKRRLREGEALIQFTADQQCDKGWVGWIFAFDQATAIEDRAR